METAELEPPAVKRKINAEDEADLFKLHRRLGEAQTKRFNTKQADMHAKQAVEAAQAELNEFVQNLLDPTPTLFTPQDEPQEWRAATLDDLGIKGKLAEHLAANDPPLTTLGAIADFSKEYELMKVKGIGPKAATDIEDALEKWWADHPEANKADPESDDDAAPIGKIG
jgi:hypothetical protein